MECYVFIDDSNLWIAGQKAQGKKLKDADTDTRYRIDLGKFLKLVVTKDRHISKAFLYGSVPPPNDSVWKAAKEKNFEVQTFQRSGSGREKEVDAAMITNILENLLELYYTETLDNVIFITVTGDRDLKIPIEKVLNKNVPVELWSWDDAMAREFRQLANTHSLFTANTLDSVQNSFGYTAFMSTRQKKDIDPAHAIVYRDVPRGKCFFFLLAGYVNRLMRLFYITSVDSETEGKRDLIVEFPKSNPELIFRQMHKLGHFDYQPCSYPEYTAALRQQGYKIKTTNRFEALCEIDPDYDSLVDAVESSMSSEMEDISLDEEPTGKGAEVPENNDDCDDWATEVRRKVGKMTRNKKRREMPCTWGDHCSKAKECPCIHKEEEIKLFARFPNIRFKFFKTRECNKMDQHITAEQKKRCAFAHDEVDSWCLACKMYGHLTNNCKV